MYSRALILAFCCLLIAPPLGAQITLTRGANIALDVTSDGRIAMDFRGDIWIVPASGGDAQQVTRNLRTAKRPRWSPNADRLVFQALTNLREGIWVYQFSDGSLTSLSGAAGIDTDVSWHPSGERLLFSSDPDGGGFDLFELDVATGLRWRISNHEGNETEAAWSADGRDLVYVHHRGDTWSLVLRRHGRTEEILLTSEQRIAAPSFRPDGSLISFLRQRPDGTTIDMVILSQPRLVRTLADSEAFVLAPVSWLDRFRLYYSADGQIRQRNFDAWRSRPVNFRATLEPERPPQPARDRQPLTWPNEPDGELVIRAHRLYDGVADQYQYDKDVLVKGGRIRGIVDRGDRAGMIVIDMGDLTVIPGFLDVDARLPAELSPGHGPDLLAMGITTVVATHERATEIDRLWSAKAVPGPRFLAADQWPTGALSRPEDDVTAAVATSRTAGMPVGRALPTQLRFLEIAGLDALQILRSMGANAAAAIQADPFLGRLATGSAADMLFVDGDPLERAEDALNVVAVVRNGRFFSVSGLFDRAEAAESVEKFDN